jgi:hypothetical protein
MWPNLRILFSKLDFPVVLSGFFFKEKLSHFPVERRVRRFLSQLATVFVFPSLSASFAPACVIRLVLSGL